jgi:cytochrome c biogenesis protein CcdA/thiol-disulfide isomerase/thioredoxin
VTARRHAIVVPSCAACLFALTGVVSAQLSRPKADVQPLLESTAVHSGGAVRVALRVSLPEGLHTQSNTPRDPNLIPTTLTIDAPPGVVVEEIVFPAATDLKQVGQEQPLAVFERQFVIGVRLTLAAGLPTGELVIPARLRYQACDANLCYAPSTAETGWRLRIVPPATATERNNQDTFDKIGFGRGAPAPLGPAVVQRATEPGRNQAQSPLDASAGVFDGFTLLGTTGGYLPSRDFLKFIADAEAGVRQRSLFEGRGPIAILLIVFVGGLALNLTPCVLPMIPINLAIIGAGAQAGSRRRGFLLGATYGAAMALVYGALGVVVVLTAGTFGTINASPWFNLAVALLFVILALAMFDLMTIDFSRFAGRMQIAESGRGSLLLAFSMGAVAALLAGACVAPVVIQVILFSSNLYAAGTSMALVLPFFLGVGMAVPWPLAGAGIAALPKPGAWMVRVKQVLGVLILATAVYYGYEAYTLFANRFVDRTAVASSVQEKLQAGWYSSLDDGLGAAARDQKPVLIDMWATWCKNCLTMDKTTLEDPAVNAALSRYVKIKFQAEDPDRQPAKSVMKRFDAVGLPTYVILRPRPH